MAMFDDWNWGTIANAFGQTVVPAVTSLIGANQVGKANANAAQIAQANATANKATLTAANAPAMQYLQSVTARDPNQLTPAQDIQLADTRRQMVTSTPTGLRGSGRFLTAAVNDVNNRGRAGMIATNTARSDSANMQRGNLASNLGTSIAGQNTAGNYATANAGTATAGSNNMALQNIGSYFANSMKGVNSPYGTTPGTPYGTYGAPNGYTPSAYPAPRQNQPLSLSN